MASSLSYVAFARFSGIADEAPQIPARDRLFRQTAHKQRREKEEHVERFQLPHAIRKLKQIMDLVRNSNRQAASERSFVFVCHADDEGFAAGCEFMRKHSGPHMG